MRYFLDGTWAATILNLCSLRPRRNAMQLPCVLLCTVFLTSGATPRRVLDKRPTWPVPCGASSKKNRIG